MGMMNKKFRTVVSYSEEGRKMTMVDKRNGIVDF